MTRVATGLLLVLLGVFSAAATPAQEEGEEVRRPRVLLLADNSFQSIHGNVAKALGERAEVVRSNLGHLHTGAALERLDEVLQGTDWDGIVFNFGLADLMHRDPRTKQLRAMSPKAGGVPVTTPERYAENLDAWVPLLRATGAELLWTTTLPLSSRTRSTAIAPDSLATYRAVALERMQHHAVPVLDTHAQIVDALAEAENDRQRERMHNDLLKTDLSGPLVARLAALLAD